ncbi:MAG: threonine/serine exporter family protein [Clostridia bacterium]|nr:threonine/serine exporter family protein [Clostridia bacterium]
MQMTLVGNAGEETRDRQVMHCAMDAGHILLENGAEIDRVEETMDRICRHYAVKNGSFFVLSNGLFVTDETGHGGQFADVRHIPVHGTRLDRVAAVNQLSREMEENRYTVEELQARLRQVREMPEKPRWIRVLASGIGSGCFCVLFGGGWMDALGSFLAGILLYIYALFIVKGRLSKLIYSISGGALVTAVCMLCLHFGLGESLSHMIVGSVIPLVPGVAFTNGIRDIGNEDYIAGMVRLLDAILVFMGIATGVGFMTMLASYLGGGAL